MLHCTNPNLSSVPASLDAIVSQSVTQMKTQKQNFNFYISKIYIYLGRFWESRGRNQNTKATLTDRLWQYEVKYMTATLQDLPISTVFVPRKQSNIFFPELKDPEYLFLLLRDASLLFDRKRFETAK